MTCPTEAASVQVHVVTKMLVPTERSCHKEHSCQSCEIYYIKALAFTVQKLLARLKFQTGLI